MLLRLNRLDDLQAFNFTNEEAGFEMGLLGFGGEGSQVLRGNAGHTVEELEPVGDGASGALAVAGELGDGHALDAIEAENGEDGGRFGGGVEFEELKELESATGDVGLGVDGDGSQGNHRNYGNYGMRFVFLGFILAEGVGHPASDRKSTEDE